MTTPKELLNEAVRQALTNGWDIFDAQRDKRAAWPPKDINVTESSDGRQGWDVFIPVPHIFEPISDRWEAEDLLFHIPFAKALWGEDKIIDVAIHTNPFAEEGDQQDVIRTTEAWKLHTKNLAISEGRWKYLEENL